MWYKTKFLEEYLQKNNCKISEYRKVIDIGAYDCAESLTFTSLFPNATVTAFECNPHLIDKCKVNDRINLIQKMVTDTPENNKFNICNGGLSSLCLPRYEQYNTIEVETIRMDEHLDDSKIDLVWIDVQGAELNVLRSFGDKLKKKLTINDDETLETKKYFENLFSIICFLTVSLISSILLLLNNLGSSNF